MRIQAERPANGRPWPPDLDNASEGMSDLPKKSLALPTTFLFVEQLQMTKIIVTILTIVSLLIFTACNTERDSEQNSASPIQELVLLVNDSFDIGQDIIENFEMENNA